jgi:hypothetical protein
MGSVSGLPVLVRDDFGGDSVEPGDNEITLLFAGFDITSSSITCWLSTQTFWRN